MAEKFIKKFQCHNCYATYTDVWDAQNCCEVEAVFECELCEEVHHFESSAKNCCVEIESGEEKIPQSYLEQHGQERLFN